MSHKNGELQSSDLRVRQQALLLLADVLHKRENLASALREGVLEISIQDFTASYLHRYTKLSEESVG